MKKKAVACPTVARSARLLEVGRLSIATRRHLAKKLFSIQVVQELIEFVRIDAGFEFERVRFDHERRGTLLAPHIGMIPASRMQVSR